MNLFPEIINSTSFIVLDSGKDYVINGKYGIEGKQMIFVTPEIRTVLKEIEEQV